MSESYVNTFSEWEEFLKLVYSKDKSLKKSESTPLASAFVLLSRAFSGFTMDQELKLWRAMNKMFETTSIKLDLSKDSKNLIAAILLFTAEINRKSGKK
ncbi:MAG: hypothetical protein ACTSP4_03865 [Candidatus Hodarchaeales archaeon]